MQAPFPAYQGDQPYVFVCYAHDDGDVVYPELAWLRAQGVNVWYDEGIAPGAEWSQALADALDGCAAVLFYVSPRSVVSEHCRREVNFALSRWARRWAGAFRDRERERAAAAPAAWRGGVVGGLRQGPGRHFRHSAGDRALHHRGRSQGVRHP